MIVTEIEVLLGNHTERYVLPMGLAWEDEAADALVQQLALARIRRGARVGFLTDAFALDPLVRAWIDALRRRRDRQARCRRGQDRVPADLENGRTRHRR